jgi:hypothetical protein
MTEERWRLSQAYRIPLEGVEKLDLRPELLGEANRIIERSFRCRREVDGAEDSFELQVDSLPAEVAEVCFDQSLLGPGRV